MSDLMLTAVLSMPYDMAMGDEFSRRQFWDRAQQALAEIERLTAALQHEADCVEAAKAEIERLTAERNALRDDNAKLNGWMEEEAQAAGRLQRKLNAAEEANERLTAENKVLRHTHRWDVSPQVDDSLLVCRGLHEKDEKCDLEHYVPAGRLHDAIRERDELRRQLDPMGEYASAEELIAALHAEKAEDDAMKQDARRYRWLRDTGAVSTVRAVGDAGDPTYPDAERCAQTLENCEDDLLTEAAFVRWQGREIDRLRAAIAVQPGPVSMADVEWAGKAHLADCEASNQRLRAALVAAMEIVQKERTRIAYNAKGAPPAIYEGYAGIMRRLDAIIAQAELAMGSEG